MMNDDKSEVWVREEQIADHFSDFGTPTTARGKTEFFEELTKQLAVRQSGLSWKDAWTLRLRDLGKKNRLPRGFNAKTLMSNSSSDQDLPHGFSTLCDQTDEQADHAYNMGVAAGFIKVRDPSGPLDERIFDLIGNPPAKN